MLSARSVLLTSALLLGCSGSEEPAGSIVATDDAGDSTGGTVATGGRRATGGASSTGGRRITGAGGIRPTGGSGGMGTGSAIPVNDGGATDGASAGSGGASTLNDGGDQDARPDGLDAASQTDSGAADAVGDTDVRDVAPPQTCSGGPCCNGSSFARNTVVCGRELTATYCQNPAQGLGCRLPHDVWLSSYFMEEWSDVFCSGSSAACDGVRKVSERRERDCPGDTVCHGSTVPGGTPATCGPCP